MADFAGTIIGSGLEAAPTNRIASLDNALFTAGTFLLSVTSNPQTGTTAGSIASGAVHADFAGIIQEMFGFNLFERIIVLPRVKAAGFVLSSTEFPVEVWNTFHDLAKDLTAITITGSGGITIANPFTLPKTIGPFGSIIFQAVIPSSGDVTIDEDILFVFAGITGTDMAVSGSRILVFSVAPDFQEGIEETISYLTDVLKMYDDTEQRRGLRSIPRRSLKFRALTLEARDAAGMESLLWGWQHQPYGVPFWQDAQPLEANISPGDFMIQVNTVDRLFASGGLALIWKDEFTFEALTIDEIAADSISFSTPAQFAWAAGSGTKIVPIFLGRLSKDVELTRLTCFADQLDVEFQGEALQIAAIPSGSAVQFRGFDVLEIAPNWANELKRKYARSMITMDPRTGPITVDDKGGTPIVSHELPWWIDSHAAVTALRSFLFARFGQLVPFWAPTWDQDLVLAANSSAGVSTLTIKAVFYTRFFFQNRARRFLALIPVGPGAKQYVEVTAAVDNGDGTETLTLTAPLAANTVAAVTMVCFLTFCRLASDDAKIIWHSTDFAEAVVPIQEVPRELP